MENLVSHGENINALLARYGVKFGIYKNGVFHEQLFPYDAIPRVIPADEFAKLEKGLIQRVDALNLYLADIYSGQQIVKDGGDRVPRKADLRAFVLSGGDKTAVWPSGLTRFSRNPDSFVVNSSQGGGFKDTWVLSR